VPLHLEQITAAAAELFREEEEADEGEKSDHVFNMGEAVS